MIEEIEAAGDSPEARLANSRAQLRELFERQTPMAIASDGNGKGDHATEFPRSATMKMLMKGGWASGTAALTGILLVTRPAMALKLLRYLPVSGIAKMLVARYLTSKEKKR